MPVTVGAVCFRNPICKTNVMSLQSVQSLGPADNQTVAQYINNRKIDSLRRSKKVLNLQASSTRNTLKKNQRQKEKYNQHTPVQR